MHELVDIDAILWAAVCDFWASTACNCPTASHTRQVDQAIGLHVIEHITGSRTLYRLCSIDANWSLGESVSGSSATVVDTDMSISCRGAIAEVNAFGLSACSMLREGEWCDQSEK